MPLGTSVICYAHSQPTFLATCQNMQIPAGCGSAANYDLLHQPCDEWLSLILLKVLQTQSFPYCSPASRRSKSAYSASACSISQPAWNFRRAEAWSQPSTLSWHFAIRSPPLPFRPKPRHSGGKALIPQKPCSAAEVSIPIKYEFQDS